MRTAVITIAHGRHSHLRALRAGLLRQSHPADDTIVVAMDDPELLTKAANLLGDTTSAFYIIPTE